MKGFIQKLGLAVVALSAGLASAQAWRVGPERGPVGCSLDQVRNVVRYGRTTFRRETIDLSREFRLYDRACDGIKIESITLVRVRADRANATVELAVNRIREGFAQTVFSGFSSSDVTLRPSIIRNELGRDIRDLEILVDGDLYIDSIEIRIDPRSLPSAYTERRLVGPLVDIGTTDLVNNSVREFVFRLPDENRRARGVGPLQGLELTARDDSFAISSLEITFADGNRVVLNDSRVIGERRSLWVDFSEINEVGHGRRGDGRRGGGRWRDDSDNIVEVRVRGSKGSLFGTRARLEIKGVRY